MSEFEKLPRTSHSMRAGWKSCQRKTYLRYVGGVKRRVYDSPARVIGSAFHLGIELWRTGGASVHARREANKVLENRMREFTSVEKDVEIEMSRLDAYLLGYFKRFQADLRRQWTDSETRIDIKGELGFIDCLFLDNHNQVWIVEDKTTGVTPDFDSTAMMLRLDDQLLSYAVLLEDAGYQGFGGVLFRQTIKSRKKPWKSENMLNFDKRIEDDYTIQTTDRYVEHKVVFSAETIAAYRVERDLVNKDIRNMLRTTRALEDVTRNTSSCIGKFGPCDYLVLCSDPEMRKSNKFECTSQKSLDGGALRRKLTLKEENNDSTSTGLQTSYPQQADELSGAPIPGSPDVAVWPAGNGEN